MVRHQAPFCAALDDHILDAGSKKRFRGFRNGAFPGKQQGFFFVGEQIIHIRECFCHILCRLVILALCHVRAHDLSLVLGAGEDMAQIFCPDLRKYEDTGEADDLRACREGQVYVIWTQLS